jgi:hypothetical protein
MERRKAMRNQRHESIVSLSRWIATGGWDRGAAGQREGSHGRPRSPWLSEWMMKDRMATREGGVNRSR